MDGLSVACVCACGGNSVIIGKGGGKSVFPFQIAVGIFKVSLTESANCICRCLYGRTVLRLVNGGNYESASVVEVDNRRLRFYMCVESYLLDRMGG